MVDLKSTLLPDLEDMLNDFDPDIRMAAVLELSRRLDNSEKIIDRPKKVVNLHCHTFFSFNAYGYSPSGLAWLAKKNGYQALGIVDFDVLDGVEEFLKACDILGVRGSAGIESRAFVPEFMDYEINSPGEPGITYHMGIGFSSDEVPAQVRPILNRMRKTAEFRNRSIVEKLNNHLAPVTVHYENDVLPLTPNGNATERHLVKVYWNVANKIIEDPKNYWTQKLDLPLSQISVLLKDPIAFQNMFRSKLMKLGGIGYIQPDPKSFPSIEEFHYLVKACNALPCAAWLDGTSAGERNFDELLDLFIQKGAVALNLIPDRNWNIKDPDQRKVKVQNLYQVIELAKKMDLPINIGTEMNSYGQKLVDDFEAPELKPLNQIFLDGAYFIYGHTLMQRMFGIGYQSDWAQEHLPKRKQRNDFYTQVGYIVSPGKANRQKLVGLPLQSTPERILADIQKLL